MGTKLKKFLAVFAISVLPTLVLWIPFFSRLKSFWKIPLPAEGMATVVANYDGPLYILVAKTFYDSVSISFLNGSLSPAYFAAHFPLFPLVIRFFSFFTGYPYALLISTILGSILAVYYFNKLAETFADKNNALWLTLVFALFPARWLIVRSVGSPEPLFIAAVIASVYYFQKKNFWGAGFWGVVAQLTKSPGILLFAAYSLFLFLPKIKRAAITTKAFITINHLKKYSPLLLIPTSLLGLFVFYKFRLNDFWAYFHSGDNIHLFFPPFQIFNYSAPWVGSFWLEDIIFIYLFGAYGIVRLVTKKLYILAWTAGLFFASILFVSHRDVLRYSLPMLPFLIIGFSETLSSKEFKTVFIFLLVPIYLFSIAFISQNTMPISDWAPYL